MSRNTESQSASKQPGTDREPGRAGEAGDFIPYFRLQLGREEEEAVLRVLRSGWLTTGGEALSFEREFAAFLQDMQPGQQSGQQRDGELHALAVSSATAGLHIGLKALGFEKGQGIALSPYTFAAGINSILYNGLRPLLIDTAPGAYHLDPNRLEDVLEWEAVRGKLRGVMPVHFAGLEQGGEALADICGRHGLEMIEDAAHSFPARNGSGAAQGTRGRIGVFSFYANKTLTTGEGGMIVTRSGELAETMKTLRLHGFSRDLWSRYTDAADGEKQAWYYDITALGYKYNMADILACIGRVQLRGARQFMEARRSVAERYAQAFAGRDWCTLPPAAAQTQPESQHHAWHIYSLRLNLNKITIDRDEFIIKLARAGIGSSVHFIPLHLMTYYRKHLHYKPDDFPNALESYQSTISLPIFPALTADEVERIISAVLSIGDKYCRKSSNRV